MNMHLKLPSLAGWVVAAVGVAVLMGWYADIQVLRSLLPGLVTMKANTAATFLCTGVALVLVSRPEPLSPLQRNLVLGLSGMAVLVGGLSLVQYALGMDLGLDQLLVREAAGAVDTSHPGRMAPPTALAFLLLGGALVLLVWRPRTRGVPWLVAGGSLFGALGLVAYLLDLPSLATFGPFTAMAPPTAMAFLLLAAGILLAQRARGGLPPSKRFLTLALILALALLAVAGVGAERSLRSLGRSHQTVLETVTNLQRLDALMHDLQALESEVRGFVATGDGRFLEGATGLRAAIEADLRNLRHGEGGTDSLGEGPLEALRASVEQKLAFTSSLVRMRQQGQVREATATLASGAGSDLMAQVRRQLQTLREEQDGDLRRREAQSRLSGLRTAVALTLALILALGILVAVFLTLWQEVQERRIAEARLLASTEALEEGIQERTRALQAQKVELETILDTIRTWVFYKDKDNHFVRVNRAFAEIMGMPKAEIEGASLWDLFPQEQAESFWRDDLEVLATGTPKVGIFEPMDSAKGLRWLVTDKAPYRDAEGTIIGVIGTTLDITEMKAAQDLLQQQQVALEAANRRLQQKVVELDEFNFVASHDLQEPLRKLVSFSELLPGDLPGDLPERAALDLTYIVDAGRRMQRLIQDLLTLSRTGRNEMRMTRVSLDQCLEEALENLALAVGEAQGIVTRTSLPEVHGDQAMLTRLFQNLVGNAVKFHHPDRPVRVQVSAVRDEEGWVLRVEDNGIGIEPRHFDQIFAPFKRLHGRGAYEGTGIGLSICRKIAERHGGRIWVESAVGEGTSFLVHLPIQPQPTVSQEDS